jgi:hypothetical protein
MNDERLVFEANRLKTIVLLLGCAMFLGVGIWFAQDGDRWAIVVIMISAFSFLWLLSLLFPGNMRLTVDSSGVEYKSPLRSMKLAWSDVDEFYVGYIHYGPSTSKLIAIKYSQSYAQQRTDREIPNHFNKSAEELCEILNSYRQKYGPTPVSDSAVRMS